MAKLVSAILAKNEADRYLRRVIERCREFSDAVLLLDDRSTDDTVKTAQDAGAIVRKRSVLHAPAWGHEAQARRELWEWACEEAGDDGWVLFCDADMLFCGDPRPLTRTWDANAWCFVLYDMWDDEHYRADGFWQAHLHPRPWLVRPGPSWREIGASWEHQRGIHSGHIPPAFPMLPAVAPPDTYYWLHLGYCKKPDRKLKFERYKSVWRQLNDSERAHALSIVDGDSDAGAAP